MDVCDQISDAKYTSAVIAQRLASRATFGNDTDEDLFNLVRINAVIGILERNTSRTKMVRLTPDSLQGKTVPFSSLKKRNNTLFLDLSEPKCLEVEIRTCLSDTEICNVAEVSQLLSNDV